MVRPNPRYGDPDFIPTDEFIMINGYNRNLILEKKLERESIQADNEVKNMGEFSPITGYAVPSWWEETARRSISGQGVNYGWGIDTHQKAIDYLKLSLRYFQAKVNLEEYRCHNYPRDPVFCQHATQTKGTIGHIQDLIPKIQSKITGFQFPEVSFPEILPEVFAEEEPSVINGVMEPLEAVTVPTLSTQVLQIINDITNQKIMAPTWFVNNNINWVISGQITEQAFLNTYNYEVENGRIYPAEPTVNDSIKDNMVTQKTDYFTIENGRAIGQITFTATENFNPFYYNKTILSLLQLQTRQGVNLLTPPKQNSLIFTETERDETIQFDESVNEEIFVIGESFVWLSTTPPLAFSKLNKFEIREKEPVKPISAGFMGAGIAVSAIAFTIALGYIIDQRRKK